MRPAARSTGLLLAVTLAGGLAGCGDIPKSATKKEFCSAGEKFSASKSFKQGVTAAERLKKTGTPSNIPKRARNGFVQLIERVLDAKDGQDFIKKRDNLSDDEGKNLMALTDYIQKTCTL